MEERRVKNALGGKVGAQVLKKALEFGQGHQFFEFYQNDFEESHDEQSVTQFISFRHQQGKTSTNGVHTSMSIQGAIQLVPIGINIEDAAASINFKRVKEFLTSFIDYEQVILQQIPALSFQRLRLLKTVKTKQNITAYQSHQLQEIIERNSNSAAELSLGVTEHHVVVGDRLKAYTGSTDNSKVSIVSFRHGSCSSTPFRQHQLLAFSTLRSLGLAVCTFFKCLLNRESLEDQMHMQLCPVCLRKLSILNPSMDVVRRYKRIITFCNTQNEFEWAQLAEWYKERLIVITGSYEDDADKLEDTSSSHQNAGNGPMQCRLSSNNMSPQVPSRTPVRRKVSSPLTNNAINKNLDPSKLLLLKKRMRKPKRSAPKHSLNT